MNIERDYPICLASLTFAGIGKRKAKRMIRHAVFLFGKHGGLDLCWDTKAADFCYHSEQGKFCQDWRHAMHVQYVWSERGHAE